MRVIYKLAKAEWLKNKKVSNSGYREKKLPTSESLPAISRVYIEDENGNKVQRKLRYCPNEQSVFMEEQDPKSRAKKIRFENGVYSIDPEKDPLIYQFMETLDSNGSKEGRNPDKKILFFRDDPAREAKDKLATAEELQKRLSSFWNMKEIEREAIANMWGLKTTNKPPSIWQSELFQKAQEQPQAFSDLVESGDVATVNLVIRAQKVGILTYNKTQWWFNGVSICKVPIGVNKTMHIMSHLQINQDTYAAMERQVKERENRLRAKSEVELAMESFTPADTLAKGMEKIDGKQVLTYQKGVGWRFTEPFEEIGNDTIFADKNSKEAAIEYIRENPNVKQEIFIRREGLLKEKAAKEAAKRLKGDK